MKGLSSYMIEICSGAKILSNLMRSPKPVHLKLGEWFIVSSMIDNKCFERNQFIPSFPFGGFRKESMIHYVCRPRGRYGRAYSLRYRFCSYMYCVRIISIKKFCIVAVGVFLIDMNLSLRTERNFGKFKT